MKSNYKKLGDCIEQLDVRNKDLSVDKLLGVSIEKKFIESHANIVGVDFSNYKIVKRGQFAYCPVTSRNGDKISIAKLDECDTCLISSSYTPFKVKDTNELNPDYLMLLFKNLEFDRYARYHSWGSAREVFSWDDLCNTEFNIPPIEEQEKIVRQYKTIEKSIKNATELIEINTKLIKTLYYDCKNSEKDKCSLTAEKYLSIFTGKKDVNQSLDSGKYKFYSCSPENRYSNDLLYEGEAIIIAGNGSYTGRTIFVNTGFDLYQRAYALVPKIESDLIYLFYVGYLTDFQELDLKALHGSAIPYIVYDDLAKFELNVASNYTKVAENIKKIVNYNILLKDKIENYLKIKSILISQIY